MMKMTGSGRSRGKSMWALMGAAVLAAAVSGAGTGALPASAAGRSAPLFTPQPAATVDPQTITFAPPADTPLAAGMVALSATAASGLPVAFASTTPTVCTVEAPLAPLRGAVSVASAPVNVVLHTPGTCTITADQSGGITFAAAPQVTHSFMVTFSLVIPPIVPPIVPPVIPPVTPGTPGALSATAGVSSITATWQAPAGNGVAVTGYTAVASPGPSTCTTTGATSCVMGGTAGVTYTVTVIAHAAGGHDSLPAGPSNPVTPSAPPVLSQPPATDLTLTTDKGAITTANPGQDIVFVGSGFAPNSTVTITMYSTPTVLGSAVTDGSGSFRKSITVPANLAAGAHTALAQGVAPDGTTRAMKLSITVASPAGTLPVTGVALTTLVLGAVALTVTGVVLTRIGRRRRAAQTVFTAV